MLTIDMDGEDFSVSVGTALRCTFEGRKDVFRFQKVHVLVGEKQTVLLGSLFLNRRGDCVVARSEVTGQLITPGSPRDLLRSWLDAKKTAETKP